MASSSPVLKFIDEKGFDEKIITDIAYDYHGRRLATVSADAVIRIRDLDNNGVWCVEDGCEIKSAHQVRRLLSHLWLDAAASKLLIGCFLLVHFC